MWPVRVSGHPHGPLAALGAIPCGPLLFHRALEAPWTVDRACARGRCDGREPGTPARAAEREERSLEGHERSVRFSYRMFLQSVELFIERMTGHESINHPPSPTLTCGSPHSSRQTSIRRTRPQPGQPRSSSPVKVHSTASRFTSPQWGQTIWISSMVSRIASARRSPPRPTAECRQSASPFSQTTSGWRSSCQEGDRGVSRIRAVARRVPTAGSSPRGM